MTGNQGNGQLTH